MLTEMRETVSATTDVAMPASRIAKDECMWRNISRYHGPCADEGKFPNGHAAEDDRASTDRCAVLHQRRRNFPVIGTFEFPIGSDCPRKKVIGEAYVRTNEGAILKCYSFKNRDMVLDFYP